jgi:hypothetical protein
MDDRSVDKLVARLIGALPQDWSPPRRTVTEQLTILAEHCSPLDLLALLSQTLPDDDRFVTEEKQKECRETIGAMASCMFKVAGARLGKGEASRLFHEAAKLERGERGGAKKEKLSHYDLELRRFYSRARGVPRGKTLDLPGLAKVKHAASLPGKLAKYICEEEWSPEVTEIFGGKRPDVFGLGSAETQTVAKRIRKVAKDPPGTRTIWLDGRK